MPRKDTLYVMATVIFCSFVVGFFGTSHGKPDAVYDRFETLANVIDMIDARYVDEVDRDELMYGAIEGVMNKLDEHSVFLSPKVFKEFQESMTGEFGGLGIEITVEDGVLTVVAPIEDTPAFEAGILAGDKIIEIEGKPTKGMTTTDAVKVLRGKPGTKVTITVLHPSRKKPEKITITRAKINVGSIKGYKRDENDHWDYMLDDESKIGYIRVTSFQSKTYDDFTKAVDQLQKQGMKSLVIDLRFNPGGLLRSAEQMCDLFISKGVIVSQKTRNPAGDPPPTMASDFGTYPYFDVVVLINQYSASASEILSGCLQDHKRAIVIGEKSFGKGTVQSMFYLENRSCALKMTTARYYLPSGRSIQRTKDGKNGGVTPDIEVIVPEEDMPKLLYLWREAARHVNSPVDKKPEEVPEEFLGADGKLYVDPQLKRAVDFLHDAEKHRMLVEARQGQADEAAKK